MNHRTKPPDTPDATRANTDKTFPSPSAASSGWRDARRDLAGWRWKAVAIAMILGAAARLLSPDLTAYGLDEGIASILTVQLVENGQIPLVGVKTGLHFFNPPLLPWLLAAPFAITPNPAGATVLVALLGLAAVGAMGWCAWRLSGREAAVGALALALAALSPFWIEHSRRLWGHAFLLPATTGMLVFAIRWTQDRKPWALTGAMVCIAAAQALHFSGALLWVSLAWIWWFSGRRAPIKTAPVVAGLAIPLLWYGPYFLHLIRTDFEDVRLVAGAILGRARAAGDPIGHPVASWLLLLADAGHNDPMGIDPTGRPVAYRIGMIVLRTVSLVLFLLGGLLPVLAKPLVNRRKQKALEETSPTPMLDKEKRKAAEREKAEREKAEETGSPPSPDADPPGDGALAAWGFALAVPPLLGFLLVRASFVPAYLLPAAPGLVLLTSGLGFALGRRGSPSAPVPNKRGVQPAGLFTAFVLVWAASAVWCQATVMTTLTRATPESTTFTTVRHQRQAVAWIAREAGDAPTVVNQGARALETGIDYNYMYLFWAETREPERFRILEGWREAFLIVDSKDRISEERREALERSSRSRAQFGNLTVYRLASRTD